MHNTQHAGAGEILYFISLGQRTFLSVDSTDTESHEGWYWNGPGLSLHICGDMEHGYETPNTPWNAIIHLYSFQGTRVLRGTYRPGSVPLARGRRCPTPWHKLTTYTPLEHRYGGIRNGGMAV